MSTVKKTKQRVKKLTPTERIALISDMFNIEEGEHVTFVKYHGKLIKQDRLIYADIITEIARLRTEIVERLKVPIFKVENNGKAAWLKKLFS